MNNQPYTNPAPQSAAPAYAIHLKTNRSLLKFILLGIITFGIYPIVVMCVLSGNINTVAQRYDGKSTMNWFLAMILGGITLGIVPIVWYHRVSNRIGNNLTARGIPYHVSAGTFWGWGVFGALLFGIGPFVYMHKLLKGMNLICEDFNRKGF